MFLQCRMKRLAFCSFSNRLYTQLASGSEKSVSYIKANIYIFFCLVVFPGNELGRLLTRSPNLLMNLTATTEDTRSKYVKCILKPLRLKLETFDSVPCQCKVNKNVHNLQVGVVNESLRPVCYFVHAISLNKTSKIIVRDSCRFILDQTTTIQIFFSWPIIIGAFLHADC